MNRTIVILGVGNLLMSDDGVGVHAVRSMADSPPPGTVVVDAGTDVLSTLPFLENASHALIIDAVRAGMDPGDILQIPEHKIRTGAGAHSAHAVNIISARHLLPPDTHWPEIVVLGVEPAILDYGINLSAPVAAALPRLTKLSHEIADDWHKQTTIK